MFNKRQSGFTLVEIVIVFAISSMLLVIAFLGQANIRHRSEFDEAVNKMVAVIGDARNEADASVNQDGSGDGGTNAGCNGIALQTVFGGTSLTLATAGVQLDYYKTDTASLPKTCSFRTQPVNVPASGVMVTAATRLLFVKQDNAGLVICEQPATNDPRPSYVARACDGASGAVQLGTTPATTPLKLNFTDSDGHSSEVDVDGSGTAKRVN